MDCCTNAAKLPRFESHRTCPVGGFCFRRKCLCASFLCADTRQLYHRTSGGESIKLVDVFVSPSSRRSLSREETLISRDCEVHRRGVSINSSANATKQEQERVGIGVYFQRSRGIPTRLEDFPFPCVIASDDKLQPPQIESSTEQRCRMLSQSLS